MKNIRICLLLFIIFFLCGCEANYNLVIDDNFLKEQTTISSNLTDFNNDNSVDYNLSSFYDTLYSYNQKAIFSQDCDEITDIMDSPIEKVDGCSYYNITALSSTTKKGAVFEYNYTKKNYSDSYILNMYSNGFTYTYDDNEIHFLANNFNFMEVYPKISNLKVSIKTNYAITDHNADEIIDNTYIWNISQINYTDKTIKLDLNFKKTIEEQKIEKENKIKLKNNITLFIITAIVLSLIVICILAFLKNKKNNEL